jgi:mannose-1-phosphate guanylyltransferase
MNPHALVAIMPGDHYYSDDSVLSSALEWAFETTGSRSSSIVLLGSRPRGPEIRFGWIELGTRVEGDLFQVSSFCEKPTPDAAKRLFADGSLLNTSVVVGSVDALIEMAFGSVPDLVASFFFGLSRAADDGIVRIPDSLYNATPSTDFLVRILWPNAKELNALRLHSMDWQDYGQVDRALGIVGARGERFPKGVPAWEAARRPPQDIQPHKRR